MRDEDSEQRVRHFVARARAAQDAFAGASQETVDLAVAAAGWAIMEPRRNRALAEQAVRDTGLGTVGDKIDKNHRKTLGLLRDLQGARSVGVLRDDPATGVTEIARPVGVVAAVTRRLIRWLPDQLHHQRPQGRQRRHSGTIAQGRGSLRPFAGLRP